MATMAGIDIGTNTILLLVADVEQNQVQRVLQDCVRVVRLGEGVDKHKAFQPKALLRAENCFREYGEILSNYPGVKCKAVATSGSRDANNSREFFDTMEKILKFPIEVISGEEEAKYSFCGALSDKANQENYIVLDIGGGSTEIVTKDSNGNLLRKSFDIGCVRLTERFVRNDPPLPEEVKNIRAYIQNLFQQNDDFFSQLNGKKWLGVAGSVTYLSGLILGLTKFNPEKIHGSIIQEKQLDAVVERFMKLKSVERVGLGGMDEGRADVIIAGTVILDEVLKKANIPQIEVSIRGLRFGLLI